MVTRTSCYMRAGLRVACRRFSMLNPLPQTCSGCYPPAPKVTYCPGEGDSLGEDPHPTPTPSASMFGVRDSLSTSSATTKATIVWHLQGHTSSRDGTVGTSQIEGNKVQKNTLESELGRSLSQAPGPLLYPSPYVIDSGVL